MTVAVSLDPILASYVIMILLLLENNASSALDHSVQITGSRVLPVRT